nr:hypothetical protein CFP56_33790 [Quercus suber]
MGDDDLVRCDGDSEVALVRSMAEGRRGLAKRKVSGQGRTKRTGEERAVGWRMYKVYVQLIKRFVDFIVKSSHPPSRHQRQQTCLHSRRPWSRRPWNLL